MKKLLPALGLLFGAWLGLTLSPAGSPPTTTGETTPAPLGPTLVEILEGQQSTDKPKPVGTDSHKGGAGAGVITRPAQPPIAVQTDDEAQAPPAAKPEPDNEPQVRITPGRQPREIIRQLRRSSQSITTRSVTAGRIAPSPPAPAPTTQPSVTRPLSPQSQSAAPIDGNYCPLAYQYLDWPGEIAYAICMAESYGQPDAVNQRDVHDGCRGSYGLFQIACFHADPGAMLDPQANVAKAHEIYRRNNSWRPWGAYVNGSYQRHLP